MKFKRAQHKGRPTHNKRDAVGEVRIQVILLDPKTHAHKRGNVVRTATAKRGKVSQVFRAIERALF